MVGRVVVRLSSIRNIIFSFSLDFKLFDQVKPVTEKESEL